MVPCVKPIVEDAVKDVIASLPEAQQATMGPMIKKGVQQLDFGPIADKAEKTLRMACTKNSKGQYVLCFCFCFVTVARSDNCSL